MLTLKTAARANVETVIMLLNAHGKQKIKNVITLLMQRRRLPGGVEIQIS